MAESHTDFLTSSLVYFFAFLLFQSTSKCRFCLGGMGDAQAPAISSCEHKTLQGKFIHFWWCCPCWGEGKVFEVSKVS